MRIAGFPVPMLAVAVGLGGSLPAAAQFDLQSLASMDGRCRAEIEGRTVTCTDFANFARFGNGRAAFLFSHDMKLYVFSGSRLFSRDGKGFGLQVDTVRVASETVPDRDYFGSRGECVVQAASPGEPYSEIRCDARAPGVLAPYRFSFDRISNFQNKTFR